MGIAEEIKTNLEGVATKLAGIQEHQTKVDEKLSNTVNAKDFEAAKTEVALALQKAQDMEVQVKALEGITKDIESHFAKAGGDKGKNSELEIKAKEQMTNYLRTGLDNFDADVKEMVCETIARKSLIAITGSELDTNIKSLVAGSNPNGGYWLRPDMQSAAIKRIFETSPLRSEANIVSTNNSSIEYIIDDDEATSGGWVGEIATRGDTETPKIGKLTIPVHEQFAQPKITQTMLDDAGFDVESWLFDKVTNKMGRVENTAFMVGDGSEKPKGILTYPNWSAPDTYTRKALERIASGDANLLTADGLIKLQGALLEAYQARAKFYMKRQSFTSVMLLKDSQGAYLINPRILKEGTNEILLGKSVMFMDDVPTVAADSLSVIYGDMKEGYTIVDRFGFRVIRDEVTEKPFIKLYTTKRTGGDVTNYESLKIQKIEA